MSLETILTNISTLEGEISDVKKAYDKAPAAMNEWPNFVNWPMDGDIERKPSTRWTTHRITMELRVVEGASLELSMDEVLPFLESTLDKFDAHLTLNGACQNSRIVHYSLGVLPYAGNSYLGISFVIEVTEYSSTNLAA